MPTLLEIQTDFLQAFYDRNDHGFLQHLSDKSLITPATSLAIHKGTIKAGLAKSLSSTYEVCKKLVGHDFFTGLAYTYVETFPSWSPDLADYGASFAEFIETFPPAMQLPYLADVCRLCWYYHAAGRANENPFCTLEHFALLSDDEKAQTVFQLPPSTYLLESPYPLKAIWDMCHREEATQTIQLQSEGNRLMVWRDNHTLSITELDATEWTIAKLLAEKKTLLELESAFEQAQLNMIEKLPLFLQKGWLSYENSAVPAP